MKRIQLVEWPDGTYSVRFKRGYFGSYFGSMEYVDFESAGMTWKATSKYFKDCKTKDKEVAEAAYAQLTQSVTVLKEVTVKK